MLPVWPTHPGTVGGLASIIFCHLPPHPCQWCRFNIAIIALLICFLGLWWTLLFLGVFYDCFYKTLGLFPHPENNVMSEGFPLSLKVLQPPLEVSSPLKLSLSPDRHAVSPPCTSLNACSKGEKKWLHFILFTLLVFLRLNIDSIKVEIKRKIDISTLVFPFLLTILPLNSFSPTLSILCLLLHFLPAFSKEISLVPS